MLSVWKAEDFEPRQSTRYGVKDHWEPIRPVVIEFRKSPRSELPSGDFWDPLPNCPERVERSLDVNRSLWADNLELPLFEPRAAENPFELRPERLLPESQSVRRARWLLSLVDIPRAADRRRFLTHFVELFEEFNHPNSFRALASLALYDVVADDIVTAFHLKKHWSEHPKLWSIRRPKVKGPIVPDTGRNALTWTKAVRLVELSNASPADSIIDDDWYEDWLQLPFGDPAFWSFLEYATLRLEAFAAGVLALPFELQRRDERGLPLARADGNSLDGFPLGSGSRTGQLVHSSTETWWAASCLVGELARQD